jgi:hypothetical protein
MVFQGRFFEILPARLLELDSKRRQRRVGQLDCWYGQKVDRDRANEKSRKVVNMPSSCFKGI